MKLFVLFIILELLQVTVKSLIEKRVIGGDIAPEDKYHWAVSIKGSVKSLKRNAVCGASLLKTDGNVQWLISAAHCFLPSISLTLTDPKIWSARIGLRKVDFTYETDEIKHEINVRLKSFFKKAYRTMFGESKLKVSLRKLHVEKIHIHPDYAIGRLENDIALIKLVDSIPIHEMKGVNSIAFLKDQIKPQWPEEGSKCIVVGWGCTNAGGSPSTIAKLAVLDIWSNPKCEAVFKVPIDLNQNSEFCAGYVNKSYGICPGDSGSGLACSYNGEWRLAGVVSAVHRYRPGEFPALFTRVSYFNSWIINTTKDN